MLSTFVPFLSKQYAMTSSVHNRRFTEATTCSAVTAVERWDSRIQILSVRGIASTALSGDADGSVPKHSSGIGNSGGVGFCVLVLVYGVGAAIKPLS